MKKSHAPRPFLPERLMETQRDADDRARGELAQSAALVTEVQRPGLQYAERQRDDDARPLRAAEGPTHLRDMPPPRDAFDFRAQAQARAARHDAVRQPI